MTPDLLRDAARVLADAVEAGDVCRVCRRLTSLHATTCPVPLLRAVLSRKVTTAPGSDREEPTP